MQKIRHGKIYSEKYTLRSLALFIPNYTEDLESEKEKMPPLHCHIQLPTLRYQWVVEMHLDFKNNRRT